MKVNFVTFEICTIKILEYIPLCLAYLTQHFFFKRNFKLLTVTVVPFLLLKDVPQNKYIDMIICLFILLLQMEFGYLLFFIEVLFIYSVIIILDAQHRDSLCF